MTGFVIEMERLEINRTKVYSTTLLLLKFPLFLLTLGLFIFINFRVIYFYSL